MNVSIVLSLIDRMTGPARRVASTWRSTAQQVTAASRQMQSSSTGTATAFQRVSSAAMNAAASVSRYVKSVLLAGNAKGPKPFLQGAAAGRFFNGSGGGAGVGGGLAAWLGAPAILRETLEAAKADNKFKSLVDSVNDTEMSAIRGKLRARMVRSGENYADLMSAAGDAAQIMGSAALSADVAVASSKLANVDTAGKNVSYFAETIAAIVGPDGTVGQINALADVLTKQQKLGAATAGGTIEAYKNVVAYKDLYKFDQNEMMTAIGLIKNKAPALIDSQIGNMAKYGLRLFNAPDASFKKRLRSAGLKPSDFFTDGAFDIGKAQQTLHAMAQTEKGAKRLKELFSGKNVLAGQFWQMLATIDPSKFETYLSELNAATGSLDAADKIRLEGLVGAVNKIVGQMKLLAVSIGTAMTPGLIEFSNVLGPVTGQVTHFIDLMSKQYPLMTSIVGGYAAMVAGLGMLGLFSGRAATAATALARLPLLLMVIPKYALGFAMALASWPANIARVWAMQGAMSALRYAMMGISRLGLVGLGAFAIWEIVDNWEAVKAVFKDPVKARIDWPEMPTWLKWLSNAHEKVISQANDSKDYLLKSEWFGNWRWSDLPGFGRDDRQGVINRPDPSAAYQDAGVPAILQSKARNAQAGSMASEGQKASPKGITVQANGPQVTFKQAPPAVNVNTTVNVQTNADPGAIGAAVGSSAGAAVRGAMGADGN